MIVKRWWPAVVVVALVAWFYWDFLWGRTFIWGDALTEYFAGLHYFATSIRSGRFPLWIAEVRNGMPFYSDIQLAVFYPPTWLLVLPASAERLPFTAYQVFLVVHIALGGVGMVWWLHGQGLRSMACLIGAMTFCFAAFMSLHMVHAVMLQVYAWWPWLLELVRRVVAQRTRRAIAGLVFVTAMMFLAGHPQTTLYGLYLATAYWVYLALASAPWWKSILLAVSVWLLTMLVISPALLPVAENWRWSGRTDGTLETTGGGSAPVANLIGFIAPDFFGTLQAAPSQVIFWGDAPHSVTPVAPWNYWEFGLYIGQLGWMAVVVLAIRRSPNAKFFLVMGALATWFYLGRHAGLFEFAYYLVPGASLFRVPARAANVVCICGSVLAAMLTDALLRREKLPWKLSLLAGGGLFLLTVTLWKSRWFPALANAELFEWAGQSLLKAAGLWALTLLCVAGFSLRLPWRALAVTGLLAVCLGDFWWAYGKYHRGQVNPDEFYEDLEGLVAKVRQRNERDGPQRFTQFRGSRMSEEVLFPLNMGYLHPGFETPEGYTSFLLKSTGAVMSLTNTAARLALQNVGFTARKAEDTGRMIVAPYKSALPRAKFYSRIRTFDSDAAVLAALDAGTLDYRNEIGVATNSWVSHDADREVRFVSKSPEEYELHYRASGPGIIFVSMTDYPGWRAELPMVRVFGAFQGVVIPQAGEGVVHVRFQPDVWKWGLPLSALGLVGLVAISASYTKRP